MTAHARTGDDAPDPQTLSGLLDRVAGELQTLAALVDDMQAGIGPILSEAAASQPEACRLAQNLDLVWQTLGGLRDVLALTARDAASRHCLDVDAIVADVSLADVAQRLRGLDTLEHSDDLDLF